MTVGGTTTEIDATVPVGVDVPGTSGGGGSSGSGSSGSGGKG
jgi:hypothetical protein